MLHTALFNADTLHYPFIYTYLPCIENLWTSQKCFILMWSALPTIVVTLCAMSVSAPEPSLQHHERKEPGHGGRREEEVCDEASSSGPSGNQENLLRQLHRHLQTVSPPSSLVANYVLLFL